MKLYDTNFKLQLAFVCQRDNQSSEAQQLDANHSLQCISTPVMEDVNSSTDVAIEVEVTTGVELPQPPSPAVERRLPEHRPHVKWPGSSDKKLWETVNTDLTVTLLKLRGTLEKKMEKMADIIYEYGAMRFGVQEAKVRKGVPTPPVSRRQQEIKRLIQERRQLRKQWKKASEEEKEGIEALQDDVKTRLASLRRAENLRKRRRKKEQTRTRFYKNPYKFLGSLFTKEKSGTLKTTKKDMEEHLRATNLDSKRHEQLVIPSDIPPIEPPQHHIETTPPTWKEVENTVRRARTASAPGPNGVPYKVYKNAPDVLRFLWRLMRTAWQKKMIPKAWRRAGGVLIPKEKDAVNISQFRPISLLNVEGKIFFSVIAPMHLVLCPMSSCGLPSDTITTLVKAYFQDLQFCFTTPEFTTSWQRLNVGIMAGCTISPLVFTMAMEVIIRASKWVVGGQRGDSGFRLPPLRAYMDDITTLTTTVPCTRRLLRKLEENISWARMKIKPSKSRSISIVKGVLSDLKFFIGDDSIPTLSEMPVKSLGRWYDSSLKDKDQVQQLHKDISSGLQSIDHTQLPGKLKAWCLHFGLLPRVLWPLAVYEVPISTVENMERKVTCYLKKWLGVPQCLTTISLYGDGVLKLPLTSLTEEFKCAKTRVQMTLHESRDPVVSNNAPNLATGRKWKPEVAVQEATAALRHADIVGHVQQGRGGFGLTPSRPTWNKATAPERRKMVVQEVRHQEEAARQAKAVSLSKQGQWTRWDSVERRKISWKDLWAMEVRRLSFSIRATYDVLPTPVNLHQWYGEDPNCALCSMPANLRHIFTGCKTSLTQGRYTWRHNQVLKSLASAIEDKRTATNSIPPPAAPYPPRTTFVREGARPPKIVSTPSERDQLRLARDWQMLVDVGRQLVFPPEIAVTTLRPDMVLWSHTLKKVFIIELTVPWEDSIDEAYERKHLRYADLAAEARGSGWKTEVRPVEVGCRGFVATSTTKLLRDLGVKGQSLRLAIRAVSEAAEGSSQWLWMKRADPSWGPK
ncbi:Retrovirus-related Pol polyprotein from type-2 retrotransposable element R2DM [Merluccius polli]|uniref:Retrovirus-related Pol polyprotein from type-2 retrotransposable element R2DM n=1 Tax=Merluccius polli TaxID=89951 RepID=A0AA47MUB1_MERPO|nr:Retrovirus-related Pol polyprotein from type-2 retrotransposable element R2DM [Merluccius polli]